MTGVWPQGWAKSVYIPILKAGDARECANNKTIALISHASKIQLKLLNGRMENVRDREVSVVQAGFMKKEAHEIKLQT